MPTLSYWQEGVESGRGKFGWKAYFSSAAEFPRSQVAVAGFAPTCSHRRGAYPKGAMLAMPR